MSKELTEQHLGYGEESALAIQTETAWSLETDGAFQKEPSVTLAYTIFVK